ncbi:D-glycero-beta-D-manno-heptose 1,7-bisphosphate 7-phosphatase [Pedobacter petrophilus]|uniref:D,D-heptose 1,7-bisphosphate phosphatase n=1 Tax=Pedobacter petrophilus TaxID=1908241 RepID=A0A7K0G318_9SPHI|nr:HAD family hydrolase [Pedobacter petrophilus]MRX78198.1 D-glycero-beta-D-manno-heptose 1,7-bisphosphate 7-phosphatase [Pedobacter petrophilus]
MNKALFLDRDGVINIDHGYVYKIENFFFTDEIFKIAKHYQDQGFLIIVVTNQSGIARGYYTEIDFHRLTEWMVQKFRDQNIEITKVYHCPHHPDFNGPCSCRKPMPGMILSAKAEFDLDLPNSVLIGDNKTDIEAGEKAGVGENYLIYELNINRA